MSVYTVSQIARRTGITVRTLHHYEAEGLLVPARRSDAGYRLYGRDELTRLQHIVSLKALGFSLAEIRACLEADAPSLAEALVRQVERLRDAIVRQQDLLSRIERIAQRAASGETIDAETLLSSIEASTLMEKYFTPEQMQAIKRRGEELGPERIHAVEQEWPSVIAGMQTAMQLGKIQRATKCRRSRGVGARSCASSPAATQACRTRSIRCIRENPEQMRAHGHRSRSDGLCVQGDRATSAGLMAPASCIKAAPAKGAALRAVSERGLRRINQAADARVIVTPRGNRMRTHEKRSRLSRSMRRRAYR